MEPRNKRLKIASLGSSFAAGPGIPPQIEPLGAGRSGQNYPHLLAKQLDAELTDLTISGSTLLDITVNQRIDPLTGGIFPPQLSNLPEDADIITITAGGNDINYIGAMADDASAALGLQFSSMTTGALPPKELAERLGGVLDEIHKRAPGAWVFLVEYLAVLGPDTRPGQDIPFNQERLNHHRGVASAMQKAYYDASESRGEWCKRVPVHEFSLSHGLGSKEPWVGGFAGEPILHPRLEGMKAVADLVFAMVQTVFDV
jgi:lysophospholipase L1-like esterase